MEYGLISKIFFRKDIFNIIVTLDTNLDTKKIITHFKESFQTNTQFKRKFFYINDKLLSNEIKNFDINSYLEILVKSKKNTRKILNYKLTEDFKLFICINKNSSKRVYLILNHAFGHGYDIIKLLVGMHNTNPIIPKINRNSTNLSIFSTLILIYKFLEYIISYLFTFNDPLEIKKYIETINLQLDLQTIKNFSKKHKITVNTILYSIMVKTLSMHKPNKTIYTCAAVLNPGDLKANNIIPIFLKFDNFNTLLTDISQSFNHLKDSYYIPLGFKCLEIIDMYFDSKTIDTYYDFVFKNVDCAMSSIIMPEEPDYKDNCYCKYKDWSCRFLVRPFQSEIYFNYMTYKDKINLTCSFYNNIVTNKEHFKTLVNYSTNYVLKSL
jgi:hypothetical protein